MCFLTGSRVYGQPNGDSDVDMVLRVSREDANLLQSLSDGVVNEAQVSDYGPPGSRQESDFKTLRFGKLNLICCFKDKTFQAWKDGTSECIVASPIGGLDRDSAVAIFSRIFRERKVCGRR